METWLALTIPVFTSILGLLVWKHKIHTIEIIVPLVIVCIVIASMKAIMVNNNTSDTEYWTEYAVRAEYHEKWNKYIHRTCTRTVKCGKNCTTVQSYDCSFVRTYPARWFIVTNMGNEYEISQSEYVELTKRWVNNKFVDMHRKYHSIDGDKWITTWNKLFSTVETVSTSHSYDNKPQAAATLFKFKEQDSIERVGLWSYPDIINRKQNTCLGCTSDESDTLDKLNALIGSRHKIKVFILEFPDEEPIDIAERQRIMWRGGNQNELVICINKSMTWCKSFSWADDKRTEVNVKSIMLDDSLSFDTKIHNAIDEVRHTWHIKDFHDFDYIHVPLTTSQIIWVWVIVTILSVASLIFGIYNDIDADH